MLRSNPEWRTEWKSLANGVFEESWDRVVGDSISRAWRSSPRRAAIGEEERPLVHPICFLEFLWPRLYHRTNCRDILGKKGWFPVISSAFLVLKRFILFLFRGGEDVRSTQGIFRENRVFPIHFSVLVRFTCDNLSSPRFSCSGAENTVWIWTASFNEWTMYSYVLAEKT